MADDTNGLNRRTVLKNVAAAGTLAAGLGAASGSAGASVTRKPSKVRPVEEQVGDAATVEALFAEHGQPLVDALADEGYVDASLDVAVDSFVPTDEYAASDRDGLATASMGRVSDTEVVDVRLQRQVGDAEIEFHLLPDAGDSYALVSTPDDDSVVYSDGSTEGVTTQSCTTGCDCDVRCSSDVCDCSNNYYWYYQEYEDCQQTDQGECLCDWRRGSCDCQGTHTDHCPEP